MENINNNNLELLDPDYRVHKLGIAPNQFSNWITRNVIDSTKLIKEKYRGGYRYLIAPADLPEPYRSKYYSAIKSDEKKEDPKSHSMALERLPKWQLDIIHERSFWVNRTNGMHGKQLADFLATFPLANPGVDESDVPSNKSIYRWRRLFNANGLLGLASDYGKNEGECAVHSDDLSVFESLILTQAGLVKTQAWELVKAYSLHHGNTPSGAKFPSLATFERALEKKVGKGYIKASRSITNSAKHIIEPRLQRDYTDVEAGDIYVMDHRTADVLVWNPAIKKASRPYITAIVDYKTASWLAWSVHFEASNVAHVQQVTADAIRKFGKPKEFYLDNGKDFRAKSFSGGRGNLDLEKTANSMLTALGIPPIWAIPYNSEAKIIEPAFKRLKRTFEPALKGYSGSLSYKRPDATKELEKSGKEQDFVSLSAFSAMLDNAIKIENLTVRKSGVIAGYRPIELLEKRDVITRVSEDELAVLSMRSFNPVKVTSTSITINKKSYGCSEPWFIMLNEKKVLPRIDPNNEGIAYVYDLESQKLLGTVKADFWTTPARPKTDAEHTLLKEKIHEQAKVKKFNKKRLKVKDIDIDKIGELLRLRAQQQEQEYRQTGTGDHKQITEIYRTGVYGATLPSVSYEHKNPIKLGERANWGAFNASRKLEDL